MKKTIPFWAFIGLTLWLFSCGETPQIEPSGKMIKVGVIAPFSGEELAKGENGLEGMKTAMQLQPYLVNGDGIELIVADDRDDPATSIKMLKKMAEVDGVSAIVTFSSSGQVLAMATVADTYKVPIIAVLATHPDTTGNNAYVSQLCFDDIFQGTVAALFVRDELLIDKVAVFVDPNSNYSSNLAREFERKFVSLGGMITDVIFLPNGPKDTTDILKRVHDKDPELLYLPIDVIDVIRMVKEADMLNWKPQLMASDGFISTAIAKHKEEISLLEGVLATDLFSDSMPLTSWGAKVKSRHKGRMTGYAALGIEGYVFLLSAMNRCNDPADRDCINGNIRSTSNFTGVMGKISVDSKGKANRPLLVNAIQDGRANFIVKVY